MLAIVISLISIHQGKQIKEPLEVDIYQGKINYSLAYAGAPMPNRLQIKHPNYQQALRLPEFPKNFKPLPVRSQALTPGLVQSRVIDRPGLDTPVFIVGYDKLIAQVAAT